jgi:DNA-binding CsgD family transcriptional regulator
MALPFDTSVVCPVFIGREGEMSSFARVFAQVTRRQGHTVLVSGEAGIGKSRLVAEVSARLGLEQDQVLRGTCFEQDRTLPFAPLVDLLRSLLLSPARDTTLHRLVPWAPALLPLLPSLALFLPEVKPASRLEPEQEQRRLFMALTSFLLEESTQRPLVLVIEDLHWSDETSFAFLLFLIRQSHKRPLLLVLTYRPEEVHPALAHFLSTLDRERVALSCELGTLSQEEVHAMLRATFHLKKPVRRDFLEALYHLTEGNPFFVEEVLKSLLAAGDIFFSEGNWDRKPLADLHIPRSVSDAIQQRTCLLGEAERETLAVAAVVGRQVEATLLQAVTGRPHTELLTVLDTLIAAQLLVETSRGQYTFRHALTQVAVYQGLPLSRRKTLHLTIARMLQDRPAAWRDAHLADLAAHCLQAEAWTQALDYEQQLGAQALALYAPGEAVEHMSRALAAAEHVPEANLLPLYRARGQAYDLLGAFEAARRDFEQVLQLARRAADRHEEWQSLIALGLLWTAHDYAQSSAYFQQALDLAQALGDPQKYRRSQYRLVYQLINSGQPATTTTLLEHTIAALHEQGESGTEAQVLEQLATAMFYYGDRPRAVQSYERAMALDRAIGDKRLLVSCLPIRSATASPVLAEAVVSVPGTLAERRPELEEARNLADATGWREGQAVARSIAGWVLASFGQLGEGLALAQEGRTIAAEIQCLSWLAGCACSVGDVCLMCLDPTQAIRVLQAGLADARRLGAPFWEWLCTALLARAYLLAGDLPHAAALLESARASDHVPRNSAERHLAWVRGELALASQQPQQALRLADALITSAPGRAEGQPIPALLKLRGEALCALGQVEQALGALEEACRGAQEQGALPLLWQLHGSLARVYTRAKQKLCAHGELVTARQIIAELAASLHDPVQRERFRCTALSYLPQEPPLTPRQSAKQAAGGLSEQERAIALLMAQGHSHREIAEALVISQRTVETHVGHIYAKLGISSRAQLIAWMMEKGLLPSSLP